MKKLFLVRHAKAGEHSSSHDFERELTQRGKKDAAFAGSELASRNVAVDLILSSPAARTLATAQAIAHGIHYRESEIATDRKIYDAEDSAILKVLLQIDDRYNTVLLVGHNPGFTEFANNIFNLMISSMATSSVLGGTLNIDSWSEARWGTGKLELQISPQDRD